MKEQLILTLFMGFLVGSYPMKTLYVRPSETSRDDCPTDGPCETLDEYRENSAAYLEGNEIQVIFLPGSYYSSIEEGIKIFDKKTLLIQGSGESVAFNLIEMMELSMLQLMV